MASTNKIDIQSVLKERDAKYGSFEGHAAVTQKVKCILLDHASLHERYLTADQREAIDMIAHKLGRIVNGDPDYSDSWVDIAGYATLVADRLIKEGK